MPVSATPLSSAAYLAPAVLGFQYSSGQLNHSIGQLASGNLIQQISDNVGAATTAAGLQSETAVIKQAASNVAQGSSLLAVAAGGLQQVSDILSSLQDIATRSTSTSLLDNERYFLQAQFNQGLNDIDNVVAATSFNNVALLSGFSGTYKVGPQSTDTTTITISSVTPAALFSATPDVLNATDAASAQTAVTDASNTVQGIIDYVAGAQTGFDIAGTALNQNTGGLQRASNDLVGINPTRDYASYAQKILRINQSAAALAQAYSLSPQLLTLLKPITTQAAAIPGQNDNTPKKTS